MPMWAGIRSSLSGAAWLILLLSPALADDFPALPLPPAVEGLIGLPQTYAGNRRLHLDLIRRTAEEAGLPPDVADAVVHVESRYSPGATGSVGEVGLMQVRPETAAMLGHAGGLTELFQPETNVRYGVMYLTRAWQLASGDLCRALMKYRAGWGEERMTPLSVEYCRRARQHLAAIGSPLAAGMPVPDEEVREAFAARIPAPPRRPSQEVRVALTAPVPAPPPRPAAADSPAPVAITKAGLVPAAKAERGVPRRPARQPALGAPVEVASVGAVRIPTAAPPVDTRKSKMRREIWAEHDARMRAITGRIGDAQLRISSGI
jgi:hypothetical protein